MQQAGVDEGIQVAVSMGQNPDGTLHVVNTESGEAIQINPTDDATSSDDVDVSAVTTDQVQVETE